MHPEPNLFIDGELVPAASGKTYPNINPATINELATGDWIRRGDPLCLIGDSGTGKSHLLIALGTAAAEQGYRVRYTLATRLVNELVEAADEKQLTKTINRYGRVDLALHRRARLHLLRVARRRSLVSDHQPQARTTQPRAHFKSRLLRLAHSLPQRRLHGRNDRQAR